MTSKNQVSEIKKYNKYFEFCFYHVSNKNGLTILKPFLYDKGPRSKSTIYTLIRDRTRQMHAFGVHLMAYNYFNIYFYSL